MDSRKHFVRGLLLAGFGFAVFFAAEFLVEWNRLGRPGLDALSWAGNTNTKLVDVLSPMARAYNNVLAMLLATIGLAIPLTANMHTPKLIEMFLRDRTNKVMLVLCAFGAANVIFVAYLVGPKFAPMWAYRVAVGGALLGWAALIPYFFYVVRFLDPSNILARLKLDVLRQIDAGVAGREDPEKLQDGVHERLQQICTILLKSIDRADRSVVVEGIWSLKQILDHYGRAKSRLPDAWFKVDRKDFVGLSAEALEMINEDRTWFEYKVMHQMQLAYLGALSKSADAISSISDAARVIAMGTAERGDDKALGLMVRHFNNFLREGVKRKDTHAIYDTFYQYRLLARDLGKDRPELLREIARYFSIYAGAAGAAGMPFVPMIAIFDTAWLVRRAYETKSAAAGELLGDVLRSESLAAGKPVAATVKAKLALGGFFVENKLEDEAGRVRADLRLVPAADLERLGAELLAVNQRCFWEVTDRQVNFEWMQPERREKVRAFLESCRG